MTGFPATGNEAGWFSVSTTGKAGRVAGTTLMIPAARSAHLPEGTGARRLERSKKSPLLASASWGAPFMTQRT